MRKNIFGKQFMTVNDNLVQICFQYDDEAKVSYSIGLLGRVINDPEMAKNENVQEFGMNGDKLSVQMLSDDERNFLADNEPLMTIDGKRRVLPKGVLVCSLADDKSEFVGALEKLARILRNSGQLRKKISLLKNCRALRSA